MRPLGLLATTAAFALLLGVTVPARALIVFDPTNYVQNVLTAARELQQVNNQITSLQNEAQMLINQARNLASLPYSSLQQLQSSISGPSNCWPRPSGSPTTFSRLIMPSRQVTRQRPAANRTSC